MSKNIFLIVIDWGQHCQFSNQMIPKIKISCSIKLVLFLYVLSTNDDDDDNDDDDKDNDNDDDDDDDDNDDEISSRSFMSERLSLPSLTYTEQLVLLKR